MRITVIAAPAFFEHSADDRRRCRVGQDEGTESERIAEYAGRKCYDSYGKGRPSADFHANICESGHWNVIRHAQLVYDIEGVSRSLLIELTRHHVGVNPSVRSTRYVDESASDFVVHPADEPHRWETEIQRQAVRIALAAYRATVEEVEQGLLARGVDKHLARKQARAAGARYLPHGLETSLVWSANLEAVRNVIQQRGTVHADAEIRAFAVALLEATRPYAPAYFADFEVQESPDTIGQIVVQR